VWYNRGTVYGKLGQWDKAVHDFSRAIELDPKDAALRNNRALAYRELGRQWDKALADFSKAIELDPKDAAGSYNRGNAYKELRQWDKAIADYSRAIELNPKEPQGPNDLAWMLATHADPKVRDPRRAVELARKAVALAPKVATYWNTLGTAHYRAGDWKAALDALNKSMELGNGGTSWDWFFVAMAHWQLGHKEEARPMYERAVNWMNANQPQNDELRRFRTEAAKLLGVKD
jgi:tetratricopeptide (TPR) repeat protein